MSKLYRRLVRIGEHIKINGKDDNWVRIDVIAIEESRVCLGIASSRDYLPRLKGQRIVARGFQVKPMKFVGKQGVQLGVNFGRDFVIVPRVLTQNEDIPLASSADVQTSDNNGGGHESGEPDHQDDQQFRNEQVGIRSDSARISNATTLDLSKLLQRNDSRLR